MARARQAEDYASHAVASATGAVYPAITPGMTAAASTVTLGSNRE